MKATSVNWKLVIIYYVIACAIAWPFYYLRAVNPERFSTLLPNPLFAPSLYMWGPGIAAIIVFIVFRNKHQRIISIFGGSIIRSVLFFALPLFVWAIVIALMGGLPDAYFPNGRTLAGWIVLVSAFFINIFGEELGWRGFLQDALRPLPFAPRFLLLGLMWEFWHVVSRYYQNADGTLRGRIIVALLLLILIIGVTYIIGIAVERSLSIMVAVTIHLWLNLTFDVPVVATWIVLAISIPFWVYMVRTWPRATDIGKSYV